jgi:hypothetical protein
LPSWPVRPSPLTTAPVWCRPSQARRPGAERCGTGRSARESLVVDGLAAPAGEGRFLPGVELPQWQIPVDVRPLAREDFLFRRATDPNQTRNLWDDEPEERDRMLAVLRSIVDEEHAPPEQYRRLDLPASWGHARRRS